MYLSVNLNQLAILQGTDEITDKSLRSCDGKSVFKDFVSLVQTWLSKIKVLGGYTEFYIYALVLCCSS